MSTLNYADKSLRRPVRKWPAWVESNLARRAIGLPALAPDTAHPNPNGKRTPGMVDEGPGQAMEISRRNAAVIGAALRDRLWPNGGAVASTLVLLIERRISPRHLKDPASGTPALQLSDARIAPAPKPNEIDLRNPKVENWEAAFSDYRVIDAVDKEPSLPAVYSTNTYGGKGRIVGYYDGTAKFVENASLPKGVPSAVQR